MEFGHLLTRSGLTHQKSLSSKVYHDSFCQLGSSVSLPGVIYFGAFYLLVAVAARSKAWVRSHLLAGIVASYLAGSMDVCRLLLL